MTQDDDGEFPPPTADAVARRALCVSAIATLAAVAQDLRDGVAAREQTEPFANDVRAWVSCEGLLDNLSRDETGLFDKPSEEWTKRELVDAAWRVESIGILFWSIQVLSSIPAYDQQFTNIPDIAPVFEPVTDFIRTASLRPVEEVRRARDLAELWHWRSRTTQLERDGKMPADIDVDEIVQRAANRGHQQADLPEPLRGDFVAFGKAYRDLDDTEYSTATSIARERHFALNWLRGYSEHWDETPTDT